MTKQLDANIHQKELYINWGISIFQAKFKAIRKLVFLAFISISFYGIPVVDAVAKESLKPKTDKARFRIIHGRGWAICEALLRTLNEIPQNQQTPWCDWRPSSVPGIREVSWETLDWHANLSTIHQIELQLFRNEQPSLSTDFNQWKKDFLGKIERDRREPLFRKSTSLLVAGSKVLETLVSYEPDRNSCQRQIEASRASHKAPVTPGDRFTIPFDEQHKTIKAKRSWFAVSAGGDWINYQNQPYQVKLERTSDAAIVGGFFYIYRWEDSPNSVEDYGLPYYGREICRIYFSDPFVGNW